MRVEFLFLLVLCLSGVSGNDLGMGQQNTDPKADDTLAGKWIVTVEYDGTPVYCELHLDRKGDRLSGDFDGDKLLGSVSGNSVHFVAEDNQGGGEEVTAVIEGITLSGSAAFFDALNRQHPDTRPFTARRLPERRKGRLPRHHEFAPVRFYREFSAANEPVLKVAPGDTIHTTAVDAAGTDENGIPRVIGGNPLTGPFYVHSAMPGDVLAVHLTRLKLNRDWARSDDFLVDRVVDRNLAIRMRETGKKIRWHLDLEHRIGKLENPSEHLAEYRVPLRPMLGCVAVAPRPVGGSPNTWDSGAFGGNLDFNEIVEGATVYLPVLVPGALLYVGDGHAAEGDGELNGNALETSMDIELMVDLIPAKHIAGPRLDSVTHIMTVGLGGSLEDAMRRATSEMVDWLADDYKLTLSEAAQVLGTSAEYKISEVADRNTGVVLKINKDRLKGITPSPKEGNPWSRHRSDHRP
jgi:acetamidase/formamidase